MSAHSIDREALKKFIMVSLGAPIVDVELDDLQIGLSISTAVEEYLSVGSVERSYWHTTATGSPYIELPKEVATVTGAVYSKPLELMAGLAGSSDIFSFAMSGGGFFSGALQQGGYSSNFMHSAANLATFYEFVQNRNKVFALDTTFRVLDNKLYLHPFPTPGNIIIVEYAKGYDSIVSADGAISLSNSWGIYWIKRYALACCKLMLGQIRGKYSIIAGATGENQTLNAAELLAQGKEEQAALKEELALHLSHTQFYFA